MILWQQSEIPDFSLRRLHKVRLLWIPIVRVIVRGSRSHEWSPVNRALVTMVLEYDPCSLIRSRMTEIKTYVGIQRVWRLVPMVRGLMVGRSVWGGQRLTRRLNRACSIDIGLFVA
jgi:hypothetical protein